MEWILLLIILSFLLRPKDRGKPYNQYFSLLNQQLQKKAGGQPSQLVDLDTVDSNLESVQQRLNGKTKLRLVVKSIPCLPLINYLMERTGSRRLMVFHRPFLSFLHRYYHDVDFLLGKPLPIAAIMKFWHTCDDDQKHRLHQIQWLIDSPERLRQYLRLARQQNIKLNINVEVDIGLHRGGVSSAAELSVLLGLIADHPRYLNFSGLMGYEAHIAKLPSLPWRKQQQLLRARDEVAKRFTQLVSFIQQQFPNLWHDQLTLNGAGSQTYMLYQNMSLFNDISVGSALLMPKDFERPWLRGHQAAYFIATPVLKKLNQFELPFLEKLSKTIGWWNPNWRQALFIYGGFWKAIPEAPGGLSLNRLYGRSSNQEILTSSSRTALTMDDFVFFRPQQSEAVMLEFEDLLIVRRGQIVEKWPVLSRSISEVNHG